MSPLNTMSLYNNHSVKTDNKIVFYSKHMNYFLIQQSLMRSPDHLLSWLETVPHYNIYTQSLDKMADPPCSCLCT